MTPVLRSFVAGCSVLVGVLLLVVAVNAFGGQEEAGLAVQQDESTTTQEDVPREPAPTTTTTIPPTTTTVSPTTTTTAAPSTTTTLPPPPPPDPAPESTVAPAEPPPPPPPAEDLWSVYSRCSRGYATDLYVIPGVTSHTTWGGAIELSEYHAYSAPSAKRCWVLGHEDGHAYGRTLDPNGWTPPGWPYGVERFADCYAEAVVGSQYGSCPDMGLARSLM